MHQIEIGLSFGYYFDTEEKPHNNTFSQCLAEILFPENRRGHRKDSQCTLLQRTTFEVRLVYVNCKVGFLHTKKVNHFFKVYKSLLIHGKNELSKLYINSHPF